jgi:hypothetical protein
MSVLLLIFFTRVLLNGHRENSITHQRRLCQGDQLPPMLSVLVIDVLGQFFSKANEKRLLQPLSSSRHLQHCISMSTMWFSLYVQ